MSDFLYDFSIIGGDIRQVYLTELLLKDGYSVCCYGLCDIPRSFDQNAAHVKDSLLSALRAHSIICPIPVAKLQKLMGSDSNDQIKNMHDFLLHIPENSLLFAGCIPDEIRNDPAGSDILFYDFMNDLPFVIQNSIATAEGAMCEARKAGICNFHDSHCAILGFGQCAQTLCSYSKELFSSVTIFARKESALARADIVADHAVPVCDLSKYISSYSYIFNTIPSRILTNEVLKNVSRDTVIIDIAEAPGGTDFRAASALGIQALLCPGLPGKYAPLSTAHYMKRTILSVKSKKL